MLQVKVEGSRLVFWDEASKSGTAVSFQRTLRIPDDGRSYPLPPGLGDFPLRKVKDYQDRVPASWVKHSGVFLPMYQREAMWISIQARHWRPNAIKVAAGKVNAVSGKPWDQKLCGPSKASFWGEELQDYLVCPPQPWLDGFNTGTGTIRQFVAMPLGMGYTVEGQVTGKEEHGGLQLMVLEPKPGRFPERPPPARRSAARCCAGAPMSSAAPSACCEEKAEAPAKSKKGAEMGLAAGGTMTQKIYPDPYGLSTWDESNYGRVFVHIVNSQLWTEITGEAPPATPVSPRTYTEHGYPWFKLYDEQKGDVAPSSILQKVKSVFQKDQDHGFVGFEDDGPVDVSMNQVHGLTPPQDPMDGEW